MDRTIDAAIGALAGTQHGVFSRAQALSLGISRAHLRRRRVRGQLGVLHRDVFRVVGSPETWRQRVWAAVLAAGRGAAASHRTAAALWDLDGFRPGIVEITVPVGRHLGLPGVTIHRKKDLIAVDVTATAEGLPVTTPARTIIDLAAVVHPDRVEEAMDSAARMGLASISRIWWRWGELRRRGRNGIAVMGEILGNRAKEAVPHTVLERRFLRAIGPLELPKPELQHHIRRENGSVVGRPDFVWPELHLAVEADGHGSHATRRQRRDDNVRRNELELLGWRVLNFTYEQICFEPEYVARTIRQSLHAFGSHLTENAQISASRESGGSGSPRPRPSRGRSAARRSAARRSRP